MTQSPATAATGLTASRSGNAKALLAEMLRMLDRLLADGETGIIDLRAVPLTAEDRALLSETLGSGAVEARIDALGESQLVETRYPGIWWVTHKNEVGEIVAESIEVCCVPAILQTPVEDIADGIEALRRALAGGDREP